MARSVSVPLLLLLLPLLLSSAVAYDYQQLAGVTNAIFEHGYTFESSASECPSFCDAAHWCSGYVYENGQCTRYLGDCRGPLPYGDPAPTDYKAKVACPGTELEPCACPEGWHRYGARCLKLLNEPVKSSNGYYECIKLGAQLAVPRSQEEMDHMIQAVAELTTGPLTKIWLQMYYLFGELRANDNCGPFNQTFWATGEPSLTSGVMSYSPPGLANSTEGWYTEEYNGPSHCKPLCQLTFCYRPDCVA